MTFNTTFQEVSPGLKVLGGTIAYVRHYSLDEAPATRIGLTEGQDLLYVESDSPDLYDDETTLTVVEDAKAIYDALAAAGMGELIADDLLVNEACVTQVREREGVIGLMTGGKSVLLTFHAPGYEDEESNPVYNYNVSADALAAIAPASKTRKRSAK